MERRHSKPIPNGDDAVIDHFVEAWGRMGSAWGISRTMAEVHALLHVSGEPLCTDDVMERLQISRGNASMSLRALLDWGVLNRVHRRGDRKDYFEAEQDVWSIFRAIVRERMKRELDPLLASLHEIREREHAGSGGERAAEIDARLEAMIDFLQMVTALGDRFVSPSGPGLRMAASLLSALESGASRDEGVAS